MFLSVDPHTVFFSSAPSRTKTELSNKTEQVASQGSGVLVERGLMTPGHAACEGRARSLSNTQG